MKDAWADRLYRFAMQKKARKFDVHARLLFALWNLVSSASILVNAQMLFQCVLYKARDVDIGFACGFV